MWELAVITVLVLLVGILSFCALGVILVALPLFLQLVVLGILVVTISYIIFKLKKR